MLAFFVLLLFAVQHDAEGATHHTRNAETMANDLRCYVCESMDRDHGDKCIHPTNYSRQLSRRCRDDARICIVKRFSYTTSTENSTSEPRLWSITRNCTSKCEPGCIIIGERTKLHSCITCCEKHHCNSGTGRATSQLKGGTTVVALGLASLLAHGKYHLFWQ